MIKLLLSSFATVISLCLFAQQKGAKPLSPAHPLTVSPAATYAVVVGISDYQSPDIPDLRFADRDAEAFANFLRSPAGGSLDGDHLKVLLNNGATLGQLAAALDWLMEVTKEGDNAIIYFSGHGDVEKQTLTQPGYLLCWDAPSRVYMGGGAFALNMLQEVVSTLSIQNKAKVVVITDACRSGNLAGQSIGGAQATAANLAKQYANEIKILSCQPNEYSIEGEQWGGGRGAFSFNLVDALYGLADQNNDLFVTLQEVGRYLEDHVTAEVAPVSQVPMVIGNRTERLATVDAKLLANLRSGRTSQMAMLSSIESRGIEDDVLATVDTTVRETYRLFKQALKDKVFLEPIDACADAYYLRLMAEPKMQRLHSTMTRNYAAALQDDAQQTLNEWLKTKQELSLEAATTQNLPIKLFTEKVRTYPRCLERAAELLGSKHYMYAALKARRYFFEGYLLANSNLNYNVEIGERALALFRQSLKWQPEQPQVYWQMSQVFGWNLLQPDSLEHYTRRAMEIYPNWTIPCLEAAFWLSFQYKQQSRARPFLEQASQIDSSSEDVLYHWAIFNFGEKNYVEAERQLKKAIALDSTESAIWNNLGYLYVFLDHRYAEAEPVLKKAIALDSTVACHWGNLGWLYVSTRRYAAAESALKKAITLDSTYSPAWTNLGNLYGETNRYAEAELHYKKAILLDSTVSAFWNNLGNLYIWTRRYAEAESALKKAIALDSTNAAAWNGVGFLYFKSQRYAEAEPIFWRILTADSTFIAAWNNLGNIYRETDRFDESEKMYRKAFALNADFLPTYRNYAKLKIKMGDLQAAFSYLEQAIQKGYDDYQGTQTDPGFAPLREQKERWEALMKKYFSDKIYYNLACEQSLKGELDKAFESLELSLTNGWKDYDWMQQDTDLAPLRALAAWKPLMKKYFPDQAKD